MRIGMLSTRLAGTDGVSLEAAKISQIIRRLDHEVFYCAGELEEHGPPGSLVPRMHFSHPEIKQVHDEAFGLAPAREQLHERIQAIANHLQAKIRRFLNDFEIELLFVQNALTIPMNLPLGVALTDLLETDAIPALIHNHDFYWERDRFPSDRVAGILERCFPPDLASAKHLVINSLAQKALYQRRSIESILLPNIFDFGAPPPVIDQHNADLRRTLGVRDDQVLVLQPTRVVARKGIELALDFVRRLADRGPLPSRSTPVLVVSHAAGDEGLAYLHKIEGLAGSMGVEFIYAANHFIQENGAQSSGSSYSLWDAYLHADFVTYPSLIEGFGNALIETIYFRLPALVNRYDVYREDIAPLGFDFVEIDGSVTDQAVDSARTLLTDPERRAQAVDRNFTLAAQHFSYEAVMPVLEELIASCAQL